MPFATEPMATALRALITFYETGETADREAYDIAWVQDKDVAGRHDQRLRRGLHGRARHQGRVGGARLLRQPREDARDPEARRRTRSGSRTACRGIRSTASRASAASPPTPSTSSSRPATPARSRRSASTCRTIRRSASSYGSKSVSLSNVNEAYDKSTLPEFRSEFSWTPEEAARAEKWSAFAGELTTEHARGDRPRLGQGRPSG